MTEDVNQGLEALLAYLNQSRGFDVTAYKRSTLQRRIEKRMQSLNVPSFADYEDYLEVHPGEFTYLFNVILINVTEFFRDQPAWEFLATHVVPHIIEAKGPHDLIRVWSAGCSSGEEAYSATMLFAEALGIERLRERVKVYATDVDEEALGAARLGNYPPASLEQVPTHLREKYFEQESGHYAFHKEARRVVIFGRHDLLQDPPISRVDLLLCRNTLMYFNYDSQSTILSRFHFALNNGGFLFVGRAEMLLTHNHIFTPVELKRRVFTKVVKDALTERMSMLLRANNVGLVGSPTPEKSILDVAFDVTRTPQVILDAEGNLLSANERARTLFRLSRRDLGRPFRELESPSWGSEVQHSIEQASAGHMPAKIVDVDWPATGGDHRHYEVGIRPLADTRGTLVGISVLFEDVSSYRDLEGQLQRSRQDLETTSEELQSSNEELETTNEELQSTVEELETTNEELQSTNEELETINEELQSTNEELHTMNDELRLRSGELNTANAFLESILTSMRSGIVVIDREGAIRAWNSAAEDLWGLRPEEVRGRSLVGLDIGLPVGRLNESIRACLGGQMTETMLDATDRRGKPIRCRVSCAPLSSGRDVQGAILTMAEVLGPIRSKTDT